MSDPNTPTVTGVRARKRRRSRKALIAISALVALVGLAGTAAGVFFLARDTDFVDRLTGQMTVTGTVTLDLEDMLNWGTACAGRKPLDSLQVGAPVEVSDADGKIVGLGRIQTAKEIDTRCVMTFRVDDVPSESAFYKVAVAGHSAGKFSADEMHEPLALTVG